MSHSFLQHNNNTQILEVKSLLNEYDNKAIMRAVEERIDSGNNKFVLDLSKMDFMNSVGLNFLISFTKKLKTSGGGLALANASNQIVKLLEVTKLTSFFHLESSVDDALKRLEHQSN